MASIRHNVSADLERPGAHPGLSRYLAMLSREYGSNAYTDSLDLAALLPSLGQVGQISVARLRHDDENLAAEHTFVVGRSASQVRRVSRMALCSAAPVWLVPPDWAPVVRRILVPMDYTPESAIALRSALNLARHHSLAKIVLLHVYFQDGVTIHPDSTRAYRRSLSATHDLYMDRFDCGDVNVRPIFVEGASIAKTIARVSDDERVDLIVMPARRRSRAASLLLEGTAAKSICAASCPMLVLKKPGSAVSLFESWVSSLKSADTLRFS